jgi:hypothetical protein
MQDKTWVAALGTCALLCGCGGSPYWFPEYLEPEELGEDWGTPLDGLVRGDAGYFREIDTQAPFYAYQYEEGAEVAYSADVEVEGGSVLVDISIGGADRLVVGEPLHFTSELQQIGGIWLDVYVCPNGAGLSGSADDVWITKREDGTINVVATAEAPDQNLDLDVDVIGAAPEMPMQHDPHDPPLTVSLQR